MDARTRKAVMVAAKILGSNMDNATTRKEQCVAPDLGGEKGISPISERRSGQ
jgi:hypothetical protein